MTRALFCRLFLAVAICGLTLIPTSAENKLGIGSKAPPLDIEHYLQDGNGFFGEVTEFEDGKIYVVEFWATWCGPCIQSMPHLVELQNKHRGDDVQIISISDEELATVEATMKKNYPGKDITFAELTSAYTLTVDPDGSVSKDYMEAAGQNGIPASFLVGKTGLVEWIGHPMTLDEPLAEVLADTWDREAYKKQLEQEQRFETTMQKVNQLAGSGKFEDAIKVIDKAIEEVGDGDDKATVAMRKHLENFRFNLRLDSGDTSEEVLDFFRNQLAEAKGDARAITQFSYGLMSSMQQGTDPGPLADETIAALNGEIEGAEAEIKPLMHVMIAQINAAMSKFDEAIEAQEQAVALSEGRQKERMQQMLEQLKEMASKQADDDGKDEPKK